MYGDSYKRNFKRNELEHELAGEDADQLRRMTPKEREAYWKAEAEAEAKRASANYDSWGRYNRLRYY
jgi:hypothetical protein